jgi:hypothetical protein
MNVNLTHVVAEVAAAHAAYEKALADNDVFVLNLLTWESPHTVHFGFDDMQYGSTEIRKLNALRHPVNNRIMEAATTITTFGQDNATVSTEFGCEDSELYGRRTLVWARVGPDSQPEAGLHGGWRIIASHESVVFRRACI